MDVGNTVYAKKHRSLSRCFLQFVKSFLKDFEPVKMLDFRMTPFTRAKARAKWRLLPRYSRADRVERSPRRLVNALTTIPETFRADIPAPSAAIWASPSAAFAEAPAGQWRSRSTLGGKLAGPFSRVPVLRVPISATRGEAAVSAEAVAWV
jgi:hypothetical protein